MNLMQAFLVSLAAVVAFIICAGVLAYVLAKNDLFFTIVEQGWCKIVLTWGKYSRKIGPGLRWIGIPGINTLYKRKMEFLKGVLKEDGTVMVEAHKDENIKSFKTTKYPYALPFKDEEDSHGLPLSGAVVINGRMTDSYKMFFDASDWYTTVVFLVLPCLRDIITMISYEEITGQNPDPAAVVNAVKKAKKAIARLLWEKMNDPREDGKLSVIAELLQIYGMEVNSVELASIDPPEGWRATTLAPYKAQKEREAAEEQAKTSAIMFSDTRQEETAWRAANPNATPEQIKDKQRELRDRALAKTPGYQQVDIRGLENATTAVVGGGSGAGVIVGGGQGDRKGSRNKGGGNNPDDAILRQNPAKLGPEDLSKYKATLRRRDERRQSNRNQGGSNENE